MQNGVYLLLGSNLADREQNLVAARVKIEKRVGAVVNSSSVYETQPWGNTDQPPFLNQVIEVAATENPMLVLRRLLAIEVEMGRERKEPWGPRLIDIDILFFGGEVINQPGLVIPHREIPRRRFTLVPLAEIAPDFVHPVLKKNCSEMLLECADPLEVSRYVTG